MVLPIFDKTSGFRHFSALKNLCFHDLKKSNNAIFDGHR